MSQQNEFSLSHAEVRGHARTTWVSAVLLALLCVGAPLVSVGQTITNPNFDPPAEDTSDNPNPGYGPISAWGTLLTGFGVNQESQPFLEQAAHSGTHVAFIQNSGSITQAISGFAASKMYTVTYFVSDRGLPAGATNSTSVSLDDGATSYVQPDRIVKTDGFRRIVSGPLPVSGSTSTLRINSSHITPSSLLIDTVSITRAVPAVPDNGFENPVQPSGQFELGNGGGGGTLAGTLWAFGTQNSGISDNGSAFAPPAAPDGSQCAILRATSTISTTVSNFEAGVTYSLSFEAAGRGGSLGPTETRVRLGGTTLEFSGATSITPTQGAYTTYTTDDFATTGGALLLEFVGLTGGDKTTFLDDIRLNFVAEPTIPIAVTNSTGSALSATSAVLNAELRVPFSNADVLVYWGPDNGTNEASAWSNVAAVGSWTNVAVTNISRVVGELSEGTQYYYTFRGTNSTADIWAEPSETVTTFAAPVADLAGGAVPKGGAAILRGGITAGVGADVYVCWGTSDGGDGATSAWEYVVSGGSIVEGVVSSNAIEGLLFGPSYVYRVFATNAYGSSWSAPDTFEALPLTAWTPEEISVDAWWDASDASAATLVSGEYESLADKSGNGHTVTAPAASQRPTQSTWQGLNALQIVNIGSSGDLLATASNVIQTADDFTIVTAMASSNVGRGTDGFGAGWSVQQRPNGLSVVLTTGGAQGFTVTGTAGKLQVSQLDQNAADELRFASDGSGYATAPVTKTSLRSSSRYLELGAANGSSFAGYIGEVLVFRNLISEPNRRLLEGYLAWKWDMNGDLAGAHPYKTWQPETPLPLAVTNTTASNEGATSADLAGSLDATGAVLTVTAYWSTSNNTSSAEWLADTTKGSADAGTYTNESAQVLGVTAGSLSPFTTYYYAFQAANAQTNIWASPNASFVTLAGGSAPTPGLSGGALTGGGKATLRGELLNGTSADLFICWGETDGGTTSTGDWDYVMSAGTVGENIVISNRIEDLWYGIGYNYRVFVTNGNGGTWSALDSFTTVYGVDVIYEDDFSGSAAADLNGTVPDVAKAHNGVAASSAWSGTTRVKADGFYGDSSSGDGIWLPFTPAAGKIYTLAAKMHLTAGGSDWLALSYAQNNPSGGNFAGSAGGYGSLLLRHSTTAGTAFDGLSTAGSTGITTSLGTNDVEIVLDASSGSVANWTMEYFLEGVSIAGPNTVASGSYGNIDYVGISRINTAQGYTDDLRVSRRASHSIANVAEENVGNSTADLKGSLEGAGAVFAVTAYWSLSNNVGSVAWLADSTASNGPVGVYTNVDAQALTLSADSLISGTNYYYTFRATNAAVDLWASPNEPFITTSPAVPPAAGLGGGAITAGGRATLRGELTAGGTADAYLAWGAGDGGTVTTGAWENVISIGAVSEGTILTNKIRELYYGVGYAYRVFVTNVNGGAWSALDSFTTPYAMETVFYDDFDDGDGTSITDPSARAVGTVAASAKYLVSGVNAGQVAVTNGLLDWVGPVQTSGAPGNLTANNGTQNWTFRTTPGGATHFDWAPYLAGRHYELSFTHRSAWSHPLTFGLSDDARNGSWNADDESAYDFGFGPYGPDWQSGEDGSSQNHGGAAGNVTYEVLMEVDETSGNVDAYVNDALRANRTIDFENSGRYFSFGEPGEYGGYIDDFRVSARADLAIATTAASDIEATGASLGGSLDADGAVFTVTAYWSTINNAGAAAWTNDGSASSALVGTYTNVNGQALAASATALSPVTTYYYTFVAANASTSIWASANRTFTTISAATTYILK